MGGLRNPLSPFSALVFPRLQVRPLPVSAGRLRPVKSPHPTYEQLVGMTAYSEQPVPIAFEDVNGHLNVRHYTGIASEGLDESLRRPGHPAAVARAGARRASRPSTT